MLQGAITDLFDLPKAHYSEGQNVKMYYFLFQITPVKVSLKLNWRIFRFVTFGTNGLRTGFWESGIDIFFSLPTQKDRHQIQSWALSVFIFFNNKNDFYVS